MASFKKEADAPSSPTASEASSFSPYRRRYGQQTRRQLWQQRFGQGSPRSSLRSPRKTAPKTKSSDDAPTLMEADLANRMASLSLQRKQRSKDTLMPDLSNVSYTGEEKHDTIPQSKNNVVPITPLSDQDDERKSYFSGGGTTVTTASSTTQPAIHGYAALSDDRSDHSSQHTKKNEGGEASTKDEEDVRGVQKPQHLQEEKKIPDGPDGLPEVRYYRIVYKGVVSLLSRPDPASPRSGAYLSYGEIVASRSEFEMEDFSPTKRSLPRSPVLHDTGQVRSPALPPLSPPRSVASHHSGSVSSLDTMRTASTIPNMAALHAAPENKASPQTCMRHVIRVDDVLTGGYAVDGTDKERENQNVMQTPKRSNTHHLLGPSPLPMEEPVIFTDEHGHYGFLFTNKKNTTIAERIQEPTICQSGHFLYKVTSSSPLPILTGPCEDAPKTRAMVLPGTTHEVCLKVVPEGEDEIMFLRLCHRRGWIADRRISGKSTLRSIPVVKDVTDERGMSCDASTSSLSNASLASSSIAGSIAARSRHRPPRRKRDKAMDSDKTQKTHHWRPSDSSPAKSRKSVLQTPSRKSTVSPLPGKIISPSSNISLLSDESSLDHTGYQGLAATNAAGGVHHDESLEVADHEPSKFTAPSLFLMRVNAPRGLKILDAPHFQVSNLIRGQQSTAKSPAGTTQTRGRLDTKGHQPPKPPNSIFHTMGGTHTTPPKHTSGNPAVFDGKIRTLPRGVLFEASKRMESTGASYSHGSGLIKLADNSGWAIVPRQHELDSQYRHYHGSVASIKEGEATRAFEEVGNALVDEQDSQIHGSASTMWLRIVARHGVPVACPPPYPTQSNDEDTSPTSSTAGASSIVSGGDSNYGVLTSQDSDVASSVGSAFLDAVFRTPKKRNQEKNIESRRDRDKPPKRAMDQQPVANIIPCGMCVEVDKWDTHPGFSQDFVRLVGGQGWIPRQHGGKPCTVPVECPDVRFGSFWFRVQPTRGIKVRRGPSRRAPSIKSDDGVYFSFSCGEFLRACELITMFDPTAGTETFAKLYRNRHVQYLRQGHENREHRLLSSLTTQAEWVQVHSNDQLYLEECNSAPHIQRHRQGWRYNAVHDSGIEVRNGPSFAAELSGMVLLGGESVLVNERVTGPGERITWLRLKDSKGWVHDVGLDGEIMMIAHSLHHRTDGRLAITRPVKPRPKSEHDEAKYNTLIARLFHGDGAEHDGIYKSGNYKSHK